MHSSLVRLTDPRQLYSFALFLALGAGCARNESPPSPSASSASAPSGAESASPAASSAPIPSASASAPAGPCAGAEPLAKRCLGKQVVSCHEGEAKVERQCLSIERCEAGDCVPACPEGEVYVPPTGPEGFVLGTGKVAFAFGKFTESRRGLSIGDTRHRVVLTQPFCMDATEVTSKSYGECVDNGGCEKPGTLTAWGTFRKKPEHPINMTDHMMADYYCHTRKQELPTEAQWYWAATGGDGRSYPWGNEPPDCERADYTQGDLSSPAGDFGCRGGGPSPVGTMPKGDKEWPAGRIHDLGGNVWEWMLDPYLPFAADKVSDPLPTKVTMMYVIRGGGWNRSALGIRTDMRGGEPADYKVPGLGFRCVRNPRRAE